MTIRAKALAIYAVTYLAFVAALLLAAGGILVSDFERIEKTQISRDAARARNALAASVSRLSSLVKDYSTWDDAYAYASNGAGGFAEENFTEATFVNQNIDFVLILDASGKTLFDRAYDAGTRTMKPVPPDVLKALAGAGFFRGAFAEAAGVAAGPQVFWTAASQPIVRSDASGPAAGTCIMGRELGEAELERLSRITLLPLSIRFLDDPDVAAGLKDGPLGEDEPEVLTQGPDRAVGLTLVRDVAGKPAFVLGAGADRIISSMGLVSAKYFAGVILISALALLCMTGFLMERLILRRLRATSASVGRLARDKDLKSRLPVSGGDELAFLAREINSLLESLRLAGEEATLRGEELRRARDAADEANRTKSVFLAKMNHEIRTPVNTILGMTDAAMRANPGAEIRELLEPALSAAEQLRRLIDEVLDISRIEAGKLVLASENFDLSELVESLARETEAQALGKGLAFEIELSPDVPGMVRGDAGRLRQILANLLANAVKYTDTGGVRLAVKGISPEAAPSGKIGVWFSVSDTGRGIPEDKLRTVFEAFVQAGAAGERRDGAGLGLSIAKELADLMGGSISARSTPGEGSDFTFTAFFDQPRSAPANPTVPASPASPASSEDDAPPVSGPTQTHPARLLLVEDNPANRKIVELYLKDEPYSMDVAEHGGQAVELAAARSYDAILMDMEMPVMDGYEATRRIREMEAAKNAPRTPILALTAHAWTAQRERCFACGCTAFLPKPISRAKLREAIRVSIASVADIGERGGEDAPGDGYDAGASERDALLRSAPSEGREAKRRDGTGGVLGEPGPEDLRFPEDPELDGLMPGFLDSVRMDLGAIRSGLSGGSVLEAAARGRSLKGAGKSFGLSYVARGGEMLERAASVGDVPGAGRAVEALAGYVERMEAVWAEKRGQAGPEDGISA